ncbi:uncharacterized protein E5676_scaffold775G00970 [Cucumis melo var. makuwa]|uniref:Uncharacterized protein LOC103496888 n=2 Tax=Cucumis melo TaxID=3656 RepID=A0A1S4E1G9_CUCME|nr:uncharacterized protein LOC103496888 [Cucumis melo]KAA0039544.1 uncharacterized protein E6C27_scaffold744G00030 [Cucumis melo var. makuwa]TYK01757.1 uncharacterized protein E5676_scaffold775G00970 [Cucumis melo var. makuwa]
MSPTFPSTTIHKTSSSSPSFIDKKQQQRQQQEQGQCSPFHVLNAISFPTACNTSSIGSDASSTSTEAPRGCLRFFLPHSSASSKTPANKLKPSSKTPKSISNVRAIKPLRSKPLKEKAPKPAVKLHSRAARPTSTKLDPLKKNSPCLYRWPSGKKPSSLCTHKSKMLASSGEELGNHGAHSVVRMVDDGKCEPSDLNLVPSDFNFTPMRKMENGSGFDPTVDIVVALENSNTDHSKTPPVQASISPELQCGSAIMPAVTPVCYGAGYVVSGISDKRKCRPRGLLIVGDNIASISKVKPIQIFEEDGSITKDTSNSVVLKVPSPIEASMNWLLSPCNEEDEDHKESKNASTPPKHLAESIALRSVPSPSSINALPPDVYSPPEFQGFLEPLSCEDTSTSCARNSLNVILNEARGQQRYQVNGENSPFSVDSLSSDNVIQTPQSDSNSAKKDFPPWLSADSYEKHNQNSASELFSNLPRDSSNTITSITDLSFQFDCLATISNSMDLHQFQKILEDQAFRNNNSSCEDLLESKMRVSWREGLMSRLYEMDEFDTCRCLSDEEENVDSCSISLSDILKTPLELTDFEVDPIVSTSFCSPGLLVNEEAEEYGKCKEMRSHQVPCSCAESISTDGGGLIASGDSDWNLCYRNGLFDSYQLSS